MPREVAGQNTPPPPVDPGGIPDRSEWHVEGAYNGRPRADIVFTPGQGPQGVVDGRWKWRATMSWEHADAARSMEQERELSTAEIYDKWMKRPVSR